MKKYVTPFPGTGSRKKGRFRYHIYEAGSRLEFLYFYWGIGYLVILSVSWCAQADVLLIVTLDHLQVPEVKKYVGRDTMMKGTDNSDNRNRDCEFPKKELQLKNNLINCLLPR